MAQDIDRLIAALRLAPHPEGGYYRRIHASRVEVTCAGRVRPAMTAIQFLLRQGQCSRWHRVDADEGWHWREGGPLKLQVFDPQEDALRTLELGPHATGLAVVPAGHWQRAWTEAAYVLVDCTVAPGFVWEGFALLDAAPEIAERLHALGAADAGHGDPSP